MIAAFAACKKDKSAGASPKIIEHTIQVSSIFGKNENLDPDRKGWINLYDGLVYNKADADKNSALLDFVYNYYSLQIYAYNFHDIKSITRDFGMFPVITASKIINAEQPFISQNVFDAIKTVADIDSIFVQKNIDAFLIDQAPVVDNGKIFAFRDKNGKKGFFRVSNYNLELPDGDPATNTLTIKIEP